MINESAKDIKQHINEYEVLRNNTLGKTGKCKGYAHFLRYGMSSWLRMLSENIEIPGNRRGEEKEQKKESFSELATVMSNFFLSIKFHEVAGVL